MRVRLFVAVFAAFLAPIADAQENVEFMKVAELRQLLKRGPVTATVKTVAEGSALSSFPVTIKGVADEPNLSIIVFTTRTHIAAGMSGSPAYVTGLDGRRKKLGALAYSMGSFAVDLQWGGISPIEYMHAEAQGARKAASMASLPASFAYQGMTFTPIPLGRDTTFKGVAGGLTVSTMNSSTGTRRAGNSRTLRAGMPIMVDILEWNDQTGASTVVAATGTITHVGKDGSIYAFGHPFLGARTARYNFRTCTIMGTVLSHRSSYKMSGEHSEVLGTIDYDGEYGIYGRVGAASERPVTEFTMDFAANGKPTGSYRVQMATSPMTALIMGYAFGLVGQAAKVPFPQEASTAAFSATIGLEGHALLEFSQMYTSSRGQFGPMTIENSSYENASGSFMNDIYIPLSTSRRNLKITSTRVSFDFTPGVAPSLKVASVKFPTKLKFGENPVLDLLLVSEDNTVTLTKRMVVALDWDKIEKPTYTADTKDTDKQAEKVVGGSLSVYTANFFGMFLSENERELEAPLYFLDAKDYLANLRQNLGRSNRMVYSRVIARKRSGLDEVPDEPAQQAATGPVRPSTDDWSVQKGLTVRKVTVQKEGSVRFTVNLPPVPPGYMVAPVHKILSFEIVN